MFHCRNKSSFRSKRLLIHLLLPCSSIFHFCARNISMLDYIRFYLDILPTADIITQHVSLGNCIFYIRTHSLQFCRARKFNEARIRRPGEIQGVRRDHKQWCYKYTFWRNNTCTYAYTFYFPQVNMGSILIIQQN